MFTIIHPAARDSVKTKHQMLKVLTNRSQFKTVNTFSSFKSYKIFLNFNSISCFTISTLLTLSQWRTQLTSFYQFIDIIDMVLITIVFSSQQLGEIIDYLCTSWLYALFKFCAIFVMSVYILLVLDLCTWSTNKYNDNNWYNSHQLRRLVKAHVMWTRTRPKHADNRIRQKKQQLKFYCVRPSG